MASVLAQPAARPAVAPSVSHSPATGEERLDSTAWCAWFSRNSVRNRAIPWERGADLTPQEQATVAASIQTFQLGESGTGRHLLRMAEEHARRIGDADYPEALRLLFDEEHRHASDLGRFLDLAGVARIEHDPVNGIFRTLRHLVGLELAITVLLTAELLALVYYAALRRATRSATLRALCSEILRDEIAHVRFQADRLAVLRSQRSRLGLWLTRFGQRMLFAGTSLVVWQTHRRVFRAGGFGFRKYWRRAQREERNLLEASLGSARCSP